MSAYTDANDRPQEANEAGREAEEDRLAARISDARLAEIVRYWDAGSHVSSAEMLTLFKELQRLRSAPGASNEQNPGTPGDERRLAVGAARVEGVGATASLPEPSGGESSYRRMFEAACSSLGEIAKEAGVPEEHADDGPEAILDAIRALKQRVSPEPCGDLVAVFDAAYEPEWERVAEQDDRNGSSGEADRMATLAGIRAVFAAAGRAPEPRDEQSLLYRMAAAVASDEGPDDAAKQEARRWMADNFWRAERASTTRVDKP